MPNFKYHQSIVQYRVPILDDGSLGRPEITKQFTTEIFAPKKKKKVSTEKTLVSEQTEEEEIY